MCYRLPWPLQLFAHELRRVVGETAGSMVLSTRGMVCLLRVLLPVLESVSRVWVWVIRTGSGELANMCQ